MIDVHASPGSAELAVVLELPLRSSLRLDRPRTAGLHFGLEETGRCFVGLPPGVFLWSWRERVDTLASGTIELLPGVRNELRLPRPWR